MSDALALRIDAILPQTQCGKCGYAGCWPYAQALSAGNADLNRCPPGGEAGIRALADLLGRPVKPLAAECGVERPRLTAIIDESLCVGCVKCIPPCPVDAILGAAKQMHTVLHALCTGCELCLPACPVDCISLVPAQNPVWDHSDAALARKRYQSRLQRLARLEAEQAEARRRQKEKLLQAGLLKADNAN